MRSGTFRLQVEIGRARGVPRDERLCKRCDSGCVEDEVHFMLNCNGLNDLRETLYSKVTNIVPDFMSKSNIDKLNLLLSCPILTKFSTNFIIQSSK